MVILISGQMISAVSVLSFKDVIREQIPDVELFDSDDLDQLTELFSMEYSISTVEEL